MSYIEPPALPSLPFSDATGNVISGFPLALTVLIFGLLYFTLIGSFIIMFIFGSPIFTAYNAQGKALIQHFNTPKSGVFKTARISGGAFQYQDIRDGTVAATSKSVLGLGNKQLVMTFASFGATIPVDVLAGVSFLVRQGIKNFLDLRDKFATKVITVDNENNILSTEYKLTDEAKNTSLVKGYDFDNFPTLLEEANKEKLIPLTVEYVQEFVEKNVNADYNEAIITYSKQNTGKKIIDNSIVQLGGIVFFIVVLMLIQTVIK